MPAPLPTPAAPRTALRRRRLPALALAATAWILAAGADASPLQDGAPAAADGPPRTCLVLSGGGARGMAHAGVLRVLERERIPVDCVVGTSMGAVVGSLYASGMDAAAIEATVRGLDWEGVFDDRVDRRDTSARQRLDDRSFLVRAALGFREGRASLPPSLLQGQRLGLVLRGLLLPTAGVEDFDALPTRFRAVGTDLETGEGVVLATGDLAMAVRASMAVPGVFPPVEIGPHLLIDGGVAMNLPVDVAQQLGARRIIAVDISAPLRRREALTDPLAISDQMVTAFIARTTAEQKTRLQPGDVLIEPALGELSSMDFTGAVGVAIDAGAAAAEAALPELRALAVDEAAYAAWQARRVAHLAGEPRAIARVDVDNRSRMAERAVRAMLAEHPGQPLDRAAIEADIARLYGTGEFAQVDWSITREGGQDVLGLRTRGRDWERDGRLRMGLRIEDDFDGTSNFQLGARLERRELNARGGEWRLDAAIGKVTRLTGEWYQPIEEDRRWFVAPRLDFQGRNQPVFATSDLRAFEFRRESAEVRLTAGRLVGDLGEVAVAPFRRRSRYALRTGGLGLLGPDAELDTLSTAGLEATLYLDALDAPDFPTAGWLLQARHAAYLAGLGSDVDANASALDWLHAYGPGDGSLLLRARLRYVDSFDLPEEVVFLGGFQNLSGYSEDALFGRMSAFGSATWYQPIGGFLRYRLYAGGSLELGNAWSTTPAVSLDNLIFAGSVFLAADTPLGPMHLGLGQAEGGERSLYFVIGRPY